MQRRKSNLIVPMFRISSLLMLTAIVGMFAGCGGGGNVGSVSGHVKHKGKPVPNADVTFTPDSPDGKPATGRTDANGKFALATPTQGDGAQIGKYRVHIIARGPERPPKPGETGSGMPGEMMPGDPAIPVKYFAPDSSGLTFEVKKGGNTADFDLAN